jgi:5'-3' exonuclease
MDCNSIIYDAVREVESSHSEKNITVDTNAFEDEVINNVILKIELYIQMIKPTTTVYIAFDGVAPLAKMEQQRTRRYKTHYMSTIAGFGGSGKPKWNTSAITPGTAFMEKLSNQVNAHFKHNYPTKKKPMMKIGKDIGFSGVSERKEGGAGEPWFPAFENPASNIMVKSVIVSCSDQCGEGEHKLFEHCRNECAPTDNVAVYGLDADLIMLSIFHCKYAKNIYVFREAPEFLKSSIPIQVRAGDSAPYFLDIRELSRRVLDEMNCKFHDANRLNDYIFLCFFLGNDFLPHFPAMNIRTHGIQALLDIYRMYIGNFSDRFFISKTSGKIDWKMVKLFVSEVAKREHEFLLNEYNVRNKWDRRTFPETTDKEKEDLLTNAPVLFRQEEKYICPDEEMWESRYYKCLFEFNKDPCDGIERLCFNYLEGLEWVYKYYTAGCVDWQWKYNYHYPPLFADLCKYIPDKDREFVSVANNKSVSAFTQLAYVLPSSYLTLLPDKQRQYLVETYPELYLENYSFQWSFCRYFWESHPLLPSIDAKKLRELDENLGRLVY